MRLIDADALKELLIDTLESIKKNPKMDGQEAHIIAACHMLTEMIDDASTVSTARNGWISVKDRLPEVGERVLTLDKWGHIHDRMLYQFVDGFISFRPDGLKPGIDVTHWMQLPEPPEMEKTEE